MVVVTAYSLIFMQSKTLVACFGHQHQQMHKNVINKDLPITKVIKSQY